MTRSGRRVWRAATSAVFLLAAATVADAQPGVPLASQSQSPFSGSVRAGDATNEPLVLALKDAIDCSRRP